MQGLTDTPREGQNPADILELLTGHVEVSAGLDLLDADNIFVEDITDEMGPGGQVKHIGRANVHGTCHLTLYRRLAWGRDRVQPYMVVSNGAGISARFNLGVYVLTTPLTKAGEVPSKFEVDGFDTLLRLQDPVADTYWADAGQTHRAAVVAALAAAGSSAQVFLSDDPIDAELSEPMVWAVTDQGSAQWLRVVNDVLSSVSYRGLWADENGNYRSEPYQNPAVAAATWTFDTGSGKATIVGPDWTVDEDLWRAPNWWRFVRRNHSTSPVEGDGLYTVENLVGGASSQVSVGRVVPRDPVFVDAVDQAALVREGDRIVNQDMSVVKVIRLMVDPLPIVGHLDVVEVEYEDGLVDKAQVVESTTNLDGSKGEWVLEVVG